MGQGHLSKRQALQVLSDSVANDDFLNFDRYLNPLCNLLVSDENETPFTVGVFGPWGCGNSTLLAHLEKRLHEDKRKDFVVVNFNPWL